MITLTDSLTEQQVEQWVLKEYDLYPFKVERIGRVKKIFSDRGIFALKHTAVKIRQLQFVLDSLQRLREDHFTKCLPFVQTKFADPFVSVQDQLYYVTSWVDEAIEEKYTHQCEIQMIQCLGELHQTSSTWPKDWAGNRISLPLPAVIKKRWQKRLKQMKEYQQFIEQRELMAPIESLFLTHYPYLVELGKRALTYLTAWEQQQEGQETRAVLCHGSVQRKHVLYGREGMYFINFDQANLDTPARDLALFYRRQMDKAVQWDEGMGQQWLEKYEQEFPLFKEEKSLLSILLLFPEMAFKEMELYFNQAREWHPMQWGTSFERKVKLTHSIRRFIRKMLDQRE